MGRYGPMPDRVESGPRDGPEKGRSSDLARLHIFEASGDVADAPKQDAFGRLGGGDLRALRVARKRVPDCSRSGDGMSQAPPRWSVSRTVFCG